MTVSFSGLHQNKINSLQASPYIQNTSCSNIKENRLQEDVFEAKTVEAKFGGFKIKCKPIKSVLLKDNDGNDAKALLVRSIAAKGQYFIIKDDETLCRIFFANNGENIYIYDLQGQYNKGKYKGAGCELIKTAIDASIKNGYDGRLNLSMAGSLPFYFKCNFRIPKNTPGSLKKNAFIDYITRHPQFDTGDFIANSWSPPNGECLDKKGAAALLENKRFIDDSMSETLYTTTLKTGEGDTIEADVDFCDFSNDPSINRDNSCSTKVIQIINKEGKNGITFPQIAHVEYSFTEYKTIDIKNIEIRTNDEILKEQIKEELLKALKIMAVKDK